MQNTDFELSALELAKLKQAIRQFSRGFRASEGEPVNDVTVCFEFGVPFLRFVTVSVSGSKPVDLDDIDLALAPSP
jgi:hypothetical protein